LLYYVFYGPHFSWREKKGKLPVGRVPAQAMAALLSMLVTACTGPTLIGIIKVFDDGTQAIIYTGAVEIGRAVTRSAGFER